MKNLVPFLFFTFLLITNTMAQTTDYSWRYYRPGNTGIQGDHVEAIWIDHDGDPYIAAYTPGWEEGGFAKYIQSKQENISDSAFQIAVIDKEGIACIFKLIASKR